MQRECNTPSLKLVMALSSIEPCSHSGQSLSYSSLCNNIVALCADLALQHIQCCDDTKVKKSLHQILSEY